MNILPFKIGWKLDARPFHETRENNLAQIMGAAIAFCQMHKDVAEAALKDNLFDIEKSVAVMPIPTGFYCVAAVCRLEEGLQTIQSMIARYDLTSLCQIVFKRLDEPAWHHHSGPVFGPFEDNQIECDKWLATLREYKAQLPKAP